MERIPVAVVGAGAFGAQHARVYASLDEAELVAVVDRDPERAAAVAAEHGCEALDDPRRLAGRVQAVSVAVPTVAHAEVGVALIESGFDVLIEKPIAPDLESADALIAAAERGGRILQVGHLERFNPAVEAAHEKKTLPLFFEVHRMGTFTARSLDVDVVLDLMIHDLDVVLSLVDSEVERIEASGLPILSQREDIASVRIVFVNGCVANLTASRISIEKIRKLRFFQPRQYVSVDYSRQDGAVVGLGAAGSLQFEPLKVTKGEPLARQLVSFLEASRTRGKPRVSGVEARRALELALRIKEEMKRHSRLIERTVAAYQP